jgi:hypothetical protein
MAEQAKQPKPKAQGRISPTEALRIMMTRMAAPRGVQRLTEAMHDWKCRIWRDGKPVPRAEVGHLSVLESYHDETGQYHASIGDDRWDAVRGEYEFDADEVMELLQKAEAVQTAAAAAEEARVEAATARAELEQAQAPRPAPDGRLAGEGEGRVAPHRPRRSEGAAQAKLRCAE